MAGCATGLMYKSYLASNKEPRLGSELVYQRDHGWLWDATVGGRVGLLRYGTENFLMLFLFQIFRFIRLVAG